MRFCRRSRYLVNFWLLRISVWSYQPALASFHWKKKINLIQLKRGATSYPDRVLSAALILFNSDKSTFCISSAGITTGSSDVVEAFLDDAGSFLCPSFWSKLNYLLNLLSIVKIGWRHKTGLIINFFESSICDSSMSPSSNLTINWSPLFAVADFTWVSASPQHPLLPISCVLSILVHPLKQLCSFLHTTPGQRRLLLRDSCLSFSEIQLPWFLSAVLESVELNPSEVLLFRLIWLISYLGAIFGNISNQKSRFSLSKSFFQIFNIFYFHIQSIWRRSMRAPALSLNTWHSSKKK